MSIKIKLAEKAKDVEKVLNYFLYIREPKKLYEAMAHIPLAGGKRLRPLMAQLTCEMVGGEGSKCIPFAAALEVIHNFTLVHDDVMDEAETRRGIEAVNHRWGNLTAILAGDFLLAKASELAASLGTEVAELLAATIGRLCEGQGRGYP